MGAGESTTANSLQYPETWDFYPPAERGVTSEDRSKTLEALLAISGLSNEDFLNVLAPIPVLEKEPWNLDDFEEYAQAAVIADQRLNKLVYRLVPKVLPEVEFWRLYYCHAYAIVQQSRGMAIVQPTRPEVQDSASIVFTKELLLAGDDTTSNAIIDAFKDDEVFKAFAKKEMEGILQRDNEDDEKLAEGIRMAVEKGVVEADPPVEPIKQTDVFGKSAEDVAKEICEALGDDATKGCVLVLQGLSGTGKGTTVAKLEQMLPRAVSWSNGNVFRSLTLLAVSYCENNGIPFGAEVLTAELLAELMSCLQFAKIDGKFDISIQGHGHDLRVSQVANTTLKEQRVGKNIPTVAKVTQGEVIKFAASAAAMMQADGMNVLMEGRAQTLNYVRTPHRFELTLSDPLVIGMRRAAQRMMAKVAHNLDGDIKASLTSALESLSAE